MTHLFVSYASLDRPRALEIAEAVRGEGIDVWIDQAGIAGGTAYGSEIANALRDADAVLLVASDASLGSKNVRQEIMLAWRYDKPIIPLILHPLVFPDEVAYWLEGAQWIEVLDHPAGEWLPKLRQALARHGLFEAPAAPSQERPPETSVETLGNLPDGLPPIVGREQEIEEVLALLAHGRTITLTGPGGTGKTRLALEIGRRLGPSFAGGAWFLDLSTVRSADLVLPSIVTALELELPPEVPPIEGIAEELRNRPTLLVLDNLEQLGASAASLGALQEAAPDLTLLLTSRSPLKLPGEWVYAVPQLPLPDLDDLPSPAALLRNPAVRLFVERAQQARADFQLGDGNARAVAEICHRLDGLPLAIELAAARTRLLPPAAMLPRLGSRLQLLTRGSSANARHQTLRDTIAWSYDLLEPDQQRAFRSFAVFAGGATVDAVETVLADGVDVAPLDLVEGLADQSLLTIDATDGGGARLRMLETVREFAQEQLDLAGDAAAINDLHATCFLDWLEGTTSELVSSRDGGVVRLVRAELGNLRAALDWLRAHDAERQIRLVNALFPYWRIGGPYTEATVELDAAIGRAEPGSGVEVARAQSALGWLAAARGDFDHATALYERALSLFELAADRDGQAATHLQLAFAAEYTADYERARRHHELRLGLLDTTDAGAIAQVKNDLGRLSFMQGQFPEAIASIREALAIYRKEADLQMIAFGLIDLASAEMLNGDAEASLTHINESVTLLRTLQDDYALAIGMLTRGRAEQLAGNFDAAQVTLEQSLADAERLGDAGMRSLALFALGANATGLGQWEVAETRLREAFLATSLLQDRRRLAVLMETLAAARAGAGQLDSAALLLGRAARERQEGGTVIEPAHRPLYDATVEAVLAAIGAEQVDELWERGRSADAKALVLG